MYESQPVHTTKDMKELDSKLIECDLSEDLSAQLQRCVEMVLEAV